MQAGEHIDFGPYGWRVLEVRDGAALIITQDIIGQRPYHDKPGAVTWAGCALRGYLNGAFYEGFGRSEQARIRTDRISRGVARATTDMWKYGNVAELERLTRRKFVEKPFPNELILYLAAFLEEEKTVGRSRRDRRAGPADSVRKRATP